MPVNPTPAAPDQKGQVHAGETMRRTGMGMFIVGLLCGLGLRFVDLEQDLVWLYLAPPLLIVAGAFFAYRGKQLTAAARSRTSIVSPDDKSPIVYLRPFTSDASGWGQIFSALLTAKMLTPVLSDEEQLAEALSPIGPLVAIGEPGEALPKPGALRAYPARWRESVEDLLSRSRLVIIRPGTTPGVLWEVERAFESVSPDRVVVLLLRVKSKDYISIRAAIAEACNVELPPFADVRRWRRAHALIEFAPDWTARVVPLKAPFWHVGALKPMVHIYKYAFLPVFQRLGAPWRPSPISAARVLAVGFPALLFAVVGVVTVSALVRDGVGDSHYSVDDTALPARAPSDTATVVMPMAKDVVIGAPEQPEPRLVAGIRITTPGDLQPVPVDPSSERSANFESSESFLIRDGRLEVSVTRMDLRPGVAFSLSGAAQGAIRGISGLPGVTNLEWTMDSTFVSNWPAIRMSAAFDLSGERWISEGLVFLARRSFWIVSANLPASQDTLVPARIVNSVRLPRL